MKNRLKFFFLNVVTLFLVIIIYSTSDSPQPALANGNNSLNQSANLYLRGDVVTTGIGLRETGTGDLTVTGIPAEASIHRAFLYWATLGSANTYNTVTLDGVGVSGDLIGNAGDTCWGVSNNFVYRADVSAWVDGNDTYQITGLPDDLYFSGNDSQGASLVVLYTGPLDDYLLRNVIIHDGAVTLDLGVNSYTDTLTGFEMDDPLTEARITYLVGDGQSQWANGDVSFNDTSIASNVFNGVDGEHWGTLTFDVTALVGNEPASTTINNEVPDGNSPDCLLWAATVFSVTRPQPVYNNFLFLPIIYATDMNP